tara:strand:- start:9839 stop:10240 length:402 start_codon:yes stop_codon:yes gene_type:complete
MKRLIDYLGILLAAFAVSYFIMFKYNPYNFCEDHPEKRQYFICQPFDFEVKKEFAESKGRFLGLGDRKYRNNKKHTIKTWLKEKKAEYNKEEKVEENKLTRKEIQAECEKILLTRKDPFKSDFFNKNCEYILE